MMPGEIDVALEDLEAFDGDQDLRPGFKMQKVTIWLGWLAGLAGWFG